ncbi:hypothetical protein JNL27_00750 [bacterium]|nr:hypothetical protein [bacterium]
MKSFVVVILILLSSHLFAQEKHTITAGNERIEIKCTPVGTGGFSKEGEISGTVPIRIVFKKNDKSDVDMFGKVVRWSYKRSEQGDDVADIYIDGNNWWSTRCIFFITTYVNAQSINYDGEKIRIGQGVDFLQRLGVPFSVSSSTSTAAN